MPKLYTARVPGNPMRASRKRLAEESKLCSFTLSENYMSKIQAMANAQTDGNKSRWIRETIDKQWRICLAKGIVED